MQELIHNLTNATDMGPDRFLWLNLKNTIKDDEKSPSEGMNLGQALVSIDKEAGASNCGIICQVCSKMEDRNCQVQHWSLYLLVSGI